MNRHEATRRVVAAIAFGPQEVGLPYVAPDGSQPLVVATPAEYLSDVLVRVDAVGGSANVALAEVKRFSIFTITKAMTAVDASEESTDHLNSDMSMGMFKIKYTGRRKSHFAVKGVDVEVNSEASSFAYA
ncbi:hypothetical protein [Microbacterium sp. JZ31]|uniref:hypothetical protein n=1 Tax=Microbacterium sp. JZ31 TaxID=1906274 RepID=UPI0019331143|nr:hypothetical protein [Microbacterium sp. JZ31]